MLLKAPADKFNMHCLNFNTNIAGLILLSAICCACSSRSSDLPFEDVEYVEEFPVIFDVRNGSIVETGRIGLQDIMLCGDDTLLISTQDSDGYITAMDLDDGTMSAGFFRQGNGPGELLYAPYFSNVSKTSQGDGTALVLGDGKGNMLKWKLDGLFRDTQPDIEIIADSLAAGMFYTLYVNDSTYICRTLSGDSSRQIRYLQRGTERITTKSMEKLNGRSIPVKRDGYLFNILSSFSRYNASKDIVIEASLMLNTIDLYSLYGDFEKTVCLGKRADDIDRICNEGPENLKETFTRLILQDDFFAVMYKGGLQFPGPGRKSPDPRIYLFGYDGSPKAELVMHEGASAFDIDADGGFLYTLDRERELIQRYDISEVLEAIG